MKILQATLCVAVMITFTFCSRPTVQDGPGTPDSAGSAGHSTNPTDNTMNADTVNHGDSTMRNDSIPR